MLHLSIPAREIFNQRTQTFKTIGGAEVDLEYSLYSVAKWESKHKKPFMAKKDFTRAELVSFYKEMCVTPDISDEVWLGLTGALEKQIVDYMADPMSAATVNPNAFRDSKPGRKKEFITAETLYFQMATFGIPFECEHWHLNRLMRLIEFCAVKNAPSKKMSKADAAKAWREQNAAMRSKTKSRG